jgi:predicted nucleic acid-binding Zn ribbon protein
MPTYLYRDLDTGETFEYDQRITDAPLSVHPETGAAVKRLIQPVGIAFKGSGFYVNDIRKPASGKPESKPAGGSEGAASKATEGKPNESKPAESKPAEGKASASGSGGSGSAPAPSASGGSASS